MLFFQGSVNGLNVGAPVKYKGVEIGSSRISCCNWKKSNWAGFLSSLNSMQRSLQEERITRCNYLVDPDELQRTIDQGLRGQLQMESFLTGVLYVAVDLYPDTPAQFVLPRGSRHPGDPDSSHRARTSAR